MKLFPAGRPFGARAGELCSSWSHHTPDGQRQKTRDFDGSGKCKQHSNRFRPSPLPRHSRPHL